MNSKKWIFVLLVCGGFSPLCKAISLPSPNAPLEAYACDNCSVEQSEELVRLQAPINACSIWQNGSPATYCEPVSKQVFILSNATQTAFKFTVTTSINSQNVPYITISTLPLTATEMELTDAYFTFNEQFNEAISSAQSILNSDYYPIQRTKSFEEFISLNNGSQDSCENHPTTYFKSAADERTIKNALIDTVQQAMDGDTAAEFVHETFFGGGSIGISKDGGSLGVDLQYIQTHRTVSKHYNDYNYLTFDIYVAASLEVNGASNVVIDLRLNKNFSKIDGFSVETLFPSGNVEVVDLEDTLMSDCWREFLQTESEPASAPPSAGTGDGSTSNPYPYNGDVSYNPGSYCIMRREVTTISTTKEGVRTQTTTTISWIDLCNMFG